MPRIERPDDFVDAVAVRRVDERLPVPGGSVKPNSACAR